MNQQKTRKASHSDIIKLVALVAFLAICVILTIVAWPYLSILGQDGGVDILIDSVQQAGAFGVIVLLVVQLIQIVIALIPGEVVQVAAGIMYGPVLGTLVILAGCVLSSGLIYLLVNRLGAPFVKDMISDKWAQKLDVFESSDKMDITVFILFLIPGLPKDLFTYVVPLTDMDPVKYLIISNMARIPGIAMSTMAANGLVTGNIVASVITFVVLAAIAVAAIVLNGKIVEVLKKKRSSK